MDSESSQMSSSERASAKLAKAGSTRSSRPSPYGLTIIILLITVVFLVLTDQALKRRTASRMVNCCQRLAKLRIPAAPPACSADSRSGFPMWTKVRSWRIRPL